MFVNIFKQVTSLSSPRFLNTAFFPSFIFWFLLILLFFGYKDIFVVSDFWGKQSVNNQLFLSIVFIVWVGLFSNILYTQLTLIYRLYEGYYFLKFFGNEWHIKHLKKLKKRFLIENDFSVFEKVRYRYPSEKIEEVLPTRLGNILRNAELYPELRYGINSFVFFPRLYPLLPERMIQMIAETKGSLDFLLIISFLSGIFAILSAIFILSFKANWLLFIACFLGGLGLAKIAYEALLNVAVMYNRHIRTSFDLYRHLIFDQISQGILIDEKDKWSSLKEFYLKNEGHDDLW